MTKIFWHCSQLILLITLDHKHQEHAENPAGTFEVVTFLPNAEGELKDIPGFGQVLETRSLQDGKVERYPISSLGKYDSIFSS